MQQLVGLTNIQSSSISWPLRICAMYEKKNSKICNFWTFWPAIQVITELSTKISKNAVFAWCIARILKGTSRVRLIFIAAFDYTYRGSLKMAYFPYILFHERRELIFPNAERSEASLSIWGHWFPTMPGEKQVSFWWIRDCLWFLVTLQVTGP